MESSSSPTMRGSKNGGEEELSSPRLIQSTLSPRKLESSNFHCCDSSNSCSSTDNVAEGVSQRFDSMDALEILRETVRILRCKSSAFMTIVAVLICPVSAILLSDALVFDRSLVKSVSLRLLSLAISSGIPPTLFLKQSCRRVSEMLVSSAFCFPLFITLSLLSKAAIVYSVACTYFGKQLWLSKFFATVAKIWRRLVSTYLLNCAAILGCVVLFVLVLTTVCNMFVIMGVPSSLIIYPAFGLAVAFSVVFAHVIIICNLANVISVLEDLSGPRAFLRAVFLIRGQTQVGLLIFLGSTIGMAFVEGLFEYRVKTLSYGDGSSRIWEGPLLVVMYSFLVLIDSMMSAVFYFTCRSSSLETLDSDDHDAPVVEPMRCFPLSLFSH
ncbi:uncharacterized protein LOC18434708 [Amborella trichopoda]|uniref:Son of sevenless n=1 Tax=Amborella trichopoda TaxID=13333 RepID=W1PFL6_AMBTC|nr:uncharacterized protein LOC18434708 [Amborella trichopoda]ERN06509.1 hypothetical protein AMTR_s00058p00077380 [Amborella trichopoda]|eukprot:XP_006844834.1 uncharacterized protein LOC18434708 [Amborella trichopoda]